MTAAQAPQDRRRDLGETIEALREQRQNTLTTYCSMTGVSKPGQGSGDVLPDIAPVAMQEFLNYMVDYLAMGCLLYTSPSPRDGLLSRMPSSA